MNTKNLVILALLVGMGTVLHTFMPGFNLGMKPDMLLAMMFLGIVLFPDFKNVLLLSIVSGVIAGLTTTFPGGLIPNMIDKPVSAFVFFALFLAFRKLQRNIISIALLTGIGTMISGVVFLGSALIIVGLPGPFIALFTGTVLPATVANIIVMVILCPVANAIMKRTKFTTSHNQQM